MSVQCQIRKLISAGSGELISSPGLCYPLLTMTMDIDFHPRTLRRNIWKALLCASDQEIHDGMHFYDGAYGLCRFFSRLHPGISPEQVAGIYSALSPMNTWDTNVSNVLDVLRYSSRTFRIDDWHPHEGNRQLSVNTSNVNRDKALRIAIGADPLSVLKGRKVTAFYRAISNPSDPSPIPVDRHLINQALGVFPDKMTQSKLASDREIYTRVENAYLDLGRREGIGNRLASVAWFVQRRIERSGQIPIFHPGAPVCCERPMHSHGIKNGWRRFHCDLCGITRSARRPSSILPSGDSRRAHIARQEVLGKLQIDSPIAFPLSVLGKAPIVYLPSGHPHRNSAGWQYAARHIVMEYTGEILRRDEHVHHIDGDKFNCQRDNLKVMLAEEHGRFHGRYQLLYMLRDHEGKWAKSDVPPFSEMGDDSDIPL